MILGSRMVWASHLVLMFAFSVQIATTNGYKMTQLAEKSLREDVNLLLLLTKGRFLSVGFQDLIDQSDFDRFLQMPPCESLSHLAEILSSSKPKQIPSIPFFSVAAASCDPSSWNILNPIIFDQEKSEYMVYLINGQSHEITDIHHIFISANLPPNSSIHVLNGFGKPQETQIGPVWTYDKRLNTMVSLQNVAKLYWRSILPPLSVSAFRIKLETAKPFNPDIIPVIGGAQALLLSLPTVFRGLTGSKALNEATLSSFATALRVDGSSGIVSNIRMQNLEQRAAASLASVVLADLGPGSDSSFAASSGKLVQESTIYYRHGAVRRDLRMVNYVLEPGVDPRAPFLDLEYSVLNSSIRSSWRTRNKSDWSIIPSGSQMSIMQDSALRMTLFYDEKPSKLNGGTINLAESSHQRVTLERFNLTFSRAQGSISSPSFLSLRSLMHPIVTIVAESGKAEGRMIQPTSLMSHADPSLVKAVKFSLDVALTVSSVSATNAELSFSRRRLTDSSIEPLRLENAGIFRFGPSTTSSSMSSFSLETSSLQNVVVTFGDGNKIPPQNAAKQASKESELTGNGTHIWTIISASIFASGFAYTFKRTQQVRLVLLIYAFFVVGTVTIASFWI